MRRAIIGGFEDQARRTPAMQLSGRNLNPQPQRVLQVGAGLLLVQTVRTNNILSVHEVLAQRVAITLESVERHTGDTRPPGSQP